MTKPGGWNGGVHPRIAVVLKRVLERLAPKLPAGDIGDDEGLVIQMKQGGWTLVIPGNKYADEDTDQDQ